MVDPLWPLADSEFFWRATSCGGQNFGNLICFPVCHVNFSFEGAKAIVKLDGGPFQNFPLDPPLPVVIGMLLPPKLMRYVNDYVSFAVQDNEALHRCSSESPEIEVTNHRK